MLRELPIPRIERGGGHTYPVADFRNAKRLSMWLVQIFVPLGAGSGDTLRDVKEDLSARFGGVTAYSRAPAEGLWRDGNAKEKDDIIIVEVMVDDLDRDWWHDFRTRLERRLDQEELVVRAHGIEKL